MISLLDKRICDVEGGENTETYREYIKSSYKEFYEEDITDEQLNKMSVDELKKLLEHLDYLWTK